MLSFMFFMQKTAYEMRISDWSSDVCSSDLLATQNPLEQEGTYPLPEAQLDRFLLQVTVGYPDLAAERTMLLATTGSEDIHAEPVFSAEELIRDQKLLRRIPVGERVGAAILSIFPSGRPDSTRVDEDARHVPWGPCPAPSRAWRLGT